MAMTLDGSNGVTFNDSSLQAAAASPFGLKNRIINGDMRIDQRNAGAAVTTTGAFPVDRFSISNNSDGTFSAQQSTSIVPTEFTHSVGITITAADTSLGATQSLVYFQRIEGYNIADLAWGTANAKTVTLSFWVRSSLTGTFGGSLRNSAMNRSYPFTYTISVANTWELKSVTIAGDTSGTWLTDSGLGITTFFGLGAGADRSGTAGAWNSNNNLSATGATSVVGTNGATWHITGVQLERNTTATPFEWLPFGTEMALCQRYYIQSYPYGTVAGTNVSGGSGSLQGVNYNQTAFGYTIMGPFSFPVTMRTSATTTIYNSATGSTTASVCIRNVNASTNVAGYVLASSDKQVYISCDNAPVTIRAECAITASAEL